MGNAVGAVLLVATLGWLVFDAAQREAELDEVIADRAATAAVRDEQIGALASGYEALREQVLDAGEVPDAPPAEDVVDDPTVVPTAPPVTVIREEVPVSVVRSVAEDIIMTEVLPGASEAASARVGPAVTAAVGACVASGECVGPSVSTEQVTSIVTAAVDAVCADGGCQGEPGPPGVDGAPGAPGSVPSDEQVAAAVAAYCASGACVGSPGLSGVDGAPGRGIVSIDCTVGDVYLEIVFTDGTTETVACLPR